MACDDANVSGNSGDKSTTDGLYYSDEPIAEKTTEGEENDPSIGETLAASQDETNDPIETEEIRGEHDSSVTEVTANRTEDPDEKNEELPCDARPGSTVAPGTSAPDIEMNGGAIETSQPNAGIDEGRASNEPQTATVPVAITVRTRRVTEVVDTLINMKNQEEVSQESVSEIGCSQGHVVVDSNADSGGDNDADDSDYDTDDEDDEQLNEKLMKQAYDTKCRQLQADKASRAQISEESDVLRKERLIGRKNCKCPNWFMFESPSRFNPHQGTSHDGTNTRQHSVQSLRLCYNGLLGRKDAGTPDIGSIYADEAEMFVALSFDDVNGEEKEVTNWPLLTESGAKTPSVPVTTEEVPGYILVVASFIHACRFAEAAKKVNKVFRSNNASDPIKLADLDKAVAINNSWDIKGAKYWFDQWPGLLAPEDKKRYIDEGGTRKLVSMCWRKLVYIRCRVIAWLLSINPNEPPKVLESHMRGEGLPLPPDTLYGPYINDATSLLLKRMIVSQVSIATLQITYDGDPHIMNQLVYILQMLFMTCDPGISYLMIITDTVNGVF